MVCRLCGSENLSSAYTQGKNGEFHFYRCQECKLINYDISGGLDQQKYGSSLMNPRKIMKMRKTAEKTYGFIQKHIKEQGRFIDIGCGSGDLLDCAHKDSWEVTGLELTPALAEYARDHYGLAITQANFLDYDDDRNQQYDVVVLRHVLEHLIEPVAAMKKIYSLLADDGYAVLEFPNINAPEFRLKHLLHKTGIHRKKYGEHYKPGHCHEFCRESFTYLLEKTGFRLLVWETYASNPLIDILYNRIPVGNKVRTIIRKTPSSQLP